MGSDHIVRKPDGIEGDKAYTSRHREPSVSAKQQFWSMPNKNSTSFKTSWHPRLSLRLRRRRSAVEPCPLYFTTVSWLSCRLSLSLSLPLSSTLILDMEATPPAPPWTRPPFNSITHFRLSFFPLLVQFGHCAKSPILAPSQLPPWRGLGHRDVTPRSYQEAIHTFQDNFPHPILGIALGYLRLWVVEAGERP